MRWMRFKVRTTSMAEDILISEMTDIGLYGAQIEDNVPLTAQEKEQMFVDIMPEEKPDDGLATVSFYVQLQEDGTLLLDEETGEIGQAAESGGSLASVPEHAGKHVTPEEVKASMEEKIRQMRSTCDFLGDGTVSIEVTEDVDWMNNWKQYFHQFWIDDILVLPSWEEPAVPEAMPALTFHIDPGTAFGTGMHETTQLCIRKIREHLTEKTRLLDVGTGSGILSILALMLGAESAVGTDLDPMAEPAIQENLEANGVDPAKFHLILGNLIDDKKTQDEAGYGRYDIVVANILPDVLVPLMPALKNAAEDGGVIITSGIVAGREDEVGDAMKKQGLTVLETARQGEWRCVVGRKI